MSISGERAYALLEKLAFVRPMGTPEEKSAARLLAEEIQGLGTTPVVEEFPVVLGDIDAERLSVVSPFSMECRVKAHPLCGSTAPEGVCVPFAYIDRLDGENVDEFAGKAVLANEVEISLERMAQAGVACLLSCQGKANEAPQLAGFRIREEKERFLLPVLAIATADALELIKRGAETLRVQVTGRERQATSQNVVAGLTGEGAPQDIIVLGAHYDSVPQGPGAADNGGGSVILMELLRHFCAHRTRQTLRFVWFGGEEEGFFGSKAYLQRHEGELQSIRLMVNIDVAGSAIGRNFVRATCEESVANAIRFLADEAGYQADIRQGLMGSDSTPFADKKIPAVGFGRGACDGLEFAHSASDRVEYCTPKALCDTAEFIALYVRRVCEAKIFPIPRGIPDNIAKRVDDMLGNHQQ